VTRGRVVAGTKAARQLAAQNGRPTPPAEQSADIRRHNAAVDARRQAKLARRTASRKG
jgi:hypothetical protein